VVGQIRQLATDDRVSSEWLRMFRPRSHWSRRDVDVCIGRKLRGCSARRLHVAVHHYPQQRRGDIERVSHDAYHRLITEVGTDPPRRPPTSSLHQASPKRKERVPTVHGVMPVARRLSRSLPIAGGLTAAMVLASCSSSTPGQTLTAISSGATPTPTTAPASSGGGAAALQNAYVATVHKVLPSVVQIETSSGLGSGIVYDNKGTSSPTTTSSPVPPRSR
jgi:hypothetical protein